MSNLATISPGYVYSWGRLTQVISSQRKFTLSHGYVFPGCVFFKVRFLQIPWHLSTWNVFYLFVVIYWIQVPFVSWAAPEKWSAFGLASCIRSRIYHWRSDPFPDFQFSQSNLLSFVCVSYSLTTAQTLAVLWI